MNDQQGRPHPCTHEEWAARGVIWTAALPPTIGHYWWLRSGGCMPTVAWLYPHPTKTGEWTWITVDSANVHESAIDNGLWWPVPLVMPPPVGMFEWGRALPEYEPLTPLAT